jgi:hypothetical protein
LGREAALARIESVRCASSHRALSQAASDALATIWVKRVDVAEGQYAPLSGVDLQQTVHGLKASWAADVLLGVHPSLITLRLVSRGARKPSAAEEEAAALHEPLDPRDLLAAAGVTDGCSLLASVAGTAVALPGECDDELRARFLLWQPCISIARCS